MALWWEGCVQVWCVGGGGYMGKYYLLELYSLESGFWNLNSGFWNLDFFLLFIKLIASG